MKLKMDNEYERKEYLNKYCAKDKWFSSIHDDDLRPNERIVTEDDCDDCERLLQEDISKREKALKKKENELKKEQEAVKLEQEKIKAEQEALEKERQHLKEEREALDKEIYEHSDIAELIS